MAVSIIADDREDEVIAVLPDLIELYNFEAGSQPKITMRKNRLAIGDFAIAIRTPDGDCTAMIIERKRWRDYAASMTDGRFESQLTNMLNERAANGCRLLYVVEGKKSIAAKEQAVSGRSRMKVGALVARMRRTILRHDVGFIQTRDVRHTAQLLIDFADDLIVLQKNGELPATFTKQAAPPQTADLLDVVVGGEIQLPKTMTTARRKTRAEVTMQMWLAVPGVSSQTYQLLKHIEIGDLILGIPAATIAVIRHEKGRAIGEKQAEKITLVGRTTDNLFDRQKIADISVAILSAVPGITEETARAIVAKHPLRDIVIAARMDLRHILNSVAEIKRGKRSLGYKIVERLVEVFCPEKTTGVSSDCVVKC